MKVLHYSQHVLGVGHFFRSLEVDKALSDCRVLLVTGGAEVEFKPAPHVTHVSLPGLMMDADFKNLFPVDPGLELEQVKARRREILIRTLAEFRPDIFLIELFPFGRKQFGFELEPALEGAARGDFGRVLPVCSLRDILVEKRDQKKYEERVLKVLNKYFKALVVHSDPRLFRLDQTFERAGRIEIPVVYSGFVAAGPSPGAGEKARAKLGIGPEEKFILASAGGGNVGGSMLAATFMASEILARERPHRLVLLTGPYLPERDFKVLKERGERKPWIRVERFRDDFADCLAGADLSVSMAGYNTCMNILAARVFGLVHPFGQNREQGMRARALEELGAVRMITEADLSPHTLARIMSSSLDRPEPGPGPEVDLDGARAAARYLKKLAGEGS